jgi:hypothetical protein
MRSRLDARLRRLEAQASEGPHGKGLAVLLDDTWRHSPAEAFDLEIPPTTGFGRLLWDARHTREKAPETGAAP